MKTSAKVVVIGGGVVGASTLYHLAKKGWTDVVLVERKELTSGSTWHAAGLLPLFNMSYSVGKLHQYSVDFYHELEKETGQDVGFSVVSNIRLASTEDRMDEYRYYSGIAQTVGVDVNFLTPEQVKEAWPMANVDGVFLPDLREAGCWGARRIDESIAEVVLDEARGVMVDVAPNIPERAPVRAVIARIWALWGGVSSYDLRNFTREVGAPWDLIWNDEDRPDDEPQSLPSGTVRLWFRDYVESEERKAALIRRQRNDMGDTQKLLARPDPGRLRVV